MKLEDFLNKYIIIEKRDGKKVKGILMDIRNHDEGEESVGYTTLVLRIDGKNYKNVYLIEVDSIGEVE